MQAATLSADKFLEWSEEMSTARAEAVAEVLWELKKADKLATYSQIATRAGFQAGSNGRSMQTCLKHIRKDWAHLDWWRAVSDDLLITKDSDQLKTLKNTDFELTTSQDPENVLLQWTNKSATAVA